MENIKIHFEKNISEVQKDILSSFWEWDSEKGYFKYTIAEWIKMSFKDIDFAKLVKAENIELENIYDYLYKLGGPIIGKCSNCKIELFPGSRNAYINSEKLTMICKKCANSKSKNKEKKESNQSKKEKPDKNLFDFCESEMEKKFLAFWISIQYFYHGKVIFPLYPQTKINDYRVDFYFKLNEFFSVIIEIDGHEFHYSDEEKEMKRKIDYKNKRDRELQKTGAYIFHFSGSELFRDTESCVLELLDFLTKRTHDILK